MKSIRFSSRFLLLWAAICATSHGQSEQTIERDGAAPRTAKVRLSLQERHVEEFVSLNDLRTLPVHLGVDPEGDVPEDGGRDLQEDGGREDETDELGTGSIEDFVLQSKNGRILAAAISTGSWLGEEERTVLVSIASLAHEVVEGAPRFRLKFTLAELADLPDFEPEEVEDVGAPEGPAVLAADYQKLTVFGTDGEFGKIRDMAVEVHDLEARYLLVRAEGASGAGEATIVVPLLAAKRVQIGNKRALRLQKSCQQLRASVVYERPDDGYLTSEQARRSDELFDVQRTEVAFVRGS